MIMIIHIMVIFFFSRYTAVRRADGNCFRVRSILSFRKDLIIVFGDYRLVYILVLKTMGALYKLYFSLKGFENRYFYRL